MNHDSISDTIANFDDNDEVNYAYENYEFYASGMVAEFEAMANHDTCSPFASTWKSGDGLTESELNDEFTAGEGSADETLTACITFIREKNLDAEKSSANLYASAFAHAYAVPDPDDETEQLYFLRILAFMDDMPFGVIFYQQFNSDESTDGFSLVGGPQLGAKLVNILND